MSDFLTNGAVALADTTGSPSGAPGHYLRQLGPTGSESMAMSRERIPTNRGNTYLGPMGLIGQKGAEHQIFANFDCKPSKGERKPGDKDPGCFVQDRLRIGDRLQSQFPRVEAGDYNQGK